MEKKQMIANVQTTPSVSDLSKRSGGKSFSLDEKAGEDFVRFLKKQKETDRITGILESGKNAMISGAGDSQKPLLAAMAADPDKPMLILVPDQKDIIRWEQDLHFFAPQLQIYSFPVVEEADFKVTFSGTERLRERMRSLGRWVGGKPAVVIATTVEAAQKIISPTFLEQGQMSLSVGEEIERERLLSDLVTRGYERVDQVERCGHFSVRGDIVDIFAISEKHPVRAEFFGDEIDSIRLFDEDTQRSFENLETFSFLPVRMEGTADASLLSYLKNGILIYDEPQRGKEALEKYFREEAANREKAFSWDELTAFSRKKKESHNKILLFSFLKRDIDGIKTEESASWEGRTMVNYQRQIGLFMNELSRLLEENWKVAILTPRFSERKEIENYLADYHISTSNRLKEGAVTLFNHILSGGFELPSLKTAWIAAGDILGKQKVRRYKAGEKGKQIRYFSDLQIGDYVVQRVHGIGKYTGLNTIELDGIHRDYITIQYAGSDKLYLPMEQIATLEKYIGPEGQTPALHRMGGAQWDKVRSKAKKSIEELAEKLLKVYADREVAEGIAFLPDTAEQSEFEDTFPFVETDDQIEAIEAVKRAMERPRPMDMLVCGDVGFGKTEVAMRAVFKCVMSGYQAMVLCPTTVLSSQHYKTFTDRMDAFGVNTAILNRFTTAKEKKEILEKLASGELDVVIGTHAVLSERIKCRRLGLLVVDEEQRFGVMQKEKWKSWSEGLDVLTLSATPIPRTLHMSLTGVRDMVTMTQPPSNRHAIQTYVTEYNDEIVKDAIAREKARGGQTYFIYNRIESIGAMENHLRNILPDDVTIAVAYGRMEGKKLEQVMVDFYEKRYDVLLCTTLIENGVDQPNANTMLVYDADKLGLSQIYQMRGRVGRSEKIARAWFFYRQGKVLSEVAEKRLNTIREFTELGSGFKIAMRDLEIRGAGNLLGSQQHGNIASVGFATYCNMLEDTVEKLRSEKEHRPVRKKLPETTVELRQDAYLDEAYITGEEQKMEIYRRLAVAETEEELTDLIDEVIDRFGSPTPPAERLFTVARIRTAARRLGIGSIIDEGQTMLITWADEKPMRHWNVNLLPLFYMSKLHFLPGSPARVRIKKAEIQGNMVKWMSDFIEEITKEIHSGEKRA